MIWLESPTLQKTLLYVSLGQHFEELLLPNPIDFRFENEHITKTKLGAPDLMVGSKSSSDKGEWTNWENRPNFSSFFGPSNEISLTTTVFIFFH